MESQIKPQLTKHEGFFQSYRKDRAEIMKSFEEVSQQMKSLKASIAQNTELIYATNEKLSACEELSDQICAALDGLGQYQRRETLEFHSIPDQSTYHKREDTSEIVMNFCDYYLGIQVKPSDISVSHRQPIEADRKKQGNRYIAPIYCRFVNRKLANHIMNKRHLLKDVRSKRGDRFFVKETLTLQRRLIRDRAQSTLTSYKFKWVKNGSIFVRKNEYARPIRVNSEATLDTLIHEQNGVRNGQVTNHRTAFVNALKLQKNLYEQFSYTRAEPKPKGDGLLNLPENFPALPTFTTQNVFLRDTAR